jgi:hypothetical protein
MQLHILGSVLSEASGLMVVLLVEYGADLDFEVYLIKLRLGV